MSRLITAARAAGSSRRTRRTGPCVGTAPACALTCAPRKPARSSFDLLSCQRDERVLEVRRTAHSVGRIAVEVLRAHDRQRRAAAPALPAAARHQLAQL